MYRSGSRKAAFPDRPPCHAEKPAVGDIQIDMPSKQHFFVKALNVEEVRALHQLKVAGPVIENGRRAQHHFVDVERGSPFPYRLIARRPSPKSRPSHKVSGISMRGAGESRPQIPHDLIEWHPMPRHEDHIGVRQKNPSYSPDLTTHQRCGRSARERPTSSAN